MLREYVDDLEEKVLDAISHLEISDFNAQRLMNEIALLKSHHLESYLHSLRVALLGVDAAGFLSIPKKPLFYAGLLHDIGKTEIDSELLSKKTPYTDEDRMKMKEHVILAHNILSGRFEMTARIVGGHHRHQRDIYPAVALSGRVSFPKTTLQSMEVEERVLSVIDKYDSIVSRDDSYSAKRPVTNEEIKAALRDHDLELSYLSSRLIDEGILSRKYLPEKRRV